MKVIVQSALGAALGGLLLAFAFFLISAISDGKNNVKVTYIDKIPVGDIGDMAISEIFAFFEDQEVDISDHLRSLDFQSYAIGKAFLNSRWRPDVFIYRVENMSARSGRSFRVEISDAEGALIYPEGGEMLNFVDFPVEQSLTLRPSSSATILIIDSIGRSAPVFSAKNSNVLFWDGEDLIELEGSGLFEDFPLFQMIKQHIFVSSILMLIGIIALVIVLVEIIFSIYPSWKIKSIVANTTDKDFAMFSIGFDRVIEENPKREDKIAILKDRLKKNLSDL